MAFKRIVANSEEDLKTIMSNIKNWFKETNDYKTEFSTEKRKFQDPDTKAIVEKDIDIIKATDNANDKFSTIKFIPMKEKGEMKVEIGGEGEAAVSGKISNQMKGKGKFKSYSKDKKVALKEQLDRRLANVFLKYKNQSIPMDFKPSSIFARLVKDLEKTGYFSTDDEVSDFMSGDDFDIYATKFNITIDEPTDNDMLSLAPEKKPQPQDMIPGRAQGDFNPDVPHRATDIYELVKTGKIKKSQLKEIIKTEIKNTIKEESMFKIEPNMAFNIYEILTKYYPKIGNDHTKSSFFYLLNKEL